MLRASVYCKQYCEDIVYYVESVVTCLSVTITLGELSLSSFQG